MNKDFYRIERISPKEFAVHKIADDDENHQIYTVTYTATNDYWHCNCRGFWMQKDKSAHKHCRMAAFWVNNLEEDPYFHLWMDKDDIEYRKFGDQF